MKRGERAAQDAERSVARYSPLMFGFFARLFARDMSSNFQAVRCLDAPPRQVAGPLVVYANHPSWWDAEVFIWMSSRFFADRRCFAPMEAAMVARYPFFGRIGAFGVETGTMRGAADFLAVAEHVLAQSDGALLVNGQGQFCDGRSRPVTLSPGLAHLARRVPAITYVPLAIEYAYWDERRPNLLLNYGKPFQVSEQTESSAVAAQLSGALETAMDALAAASMTRDPSLFRTLLSGRTGVNPVYDLWRRARATLRGQAFSPAHGDRL